MPSFCDGVAGPLAHALLVEHPQHRAERPRPALLAGEVEVARDVERRDDGQGLVDRLDAGLAGVLRPLEVDRFAVEQISPASGV